MISIIFFRNLYGRQTIGRISTQKDKKVGDVERIEGSLRQLGSIVHSIMVLGQLFGLKMQFKRII